VTAVPPGLKNILLGGYPLPLPGANMPIQPLI